MTKEIQKLFHAYIIGGTRAEAAGQISSLLEPFPDIRSGTPDYRVSEYVSFSIEDARALQAWQVLSSSRGGKKVHIIYTDFITREAENALLKMLEEPVAGTHIIFAIPKPDILLPTLRSRVRIVTARNLEVELPSEFTSLSIAERMSYVAKLVEKSDDESAAAEVRERALALLDSLEKELAEDTQKNRSKLESILKFKKYLYTPGASARMILETLALTI